MRGWPDRLVVLPHVLKFVETKRPKKGRYEPLQKHIHKFLADLGHEVRIIKTKNEVDVFIITHT